MGVSEDINDLATLLHGTVVEALYRLTEDSGETPIEAAGHVGAILEGVITGSAKFASLYDEAIANPKLLDDLGSKRMNTEIADTWSTTEQAVRRTRKKLWGEGIIH